MTEQKSRPLIEYAVIKPAVDAVALGLAIGGPAALSGNFWQGFVMGASCSFSWYWIKGNLISVDPKRKKAAKRDGYKVNWGSGKMDHFEQVMPTHITRQPLFADLFGLFKTKPRTRITGQPEIRPNRPSTLDQFAFVSCDNAGNQIQLLSCDVRNFLRRAWLHKGRGRGLGARLWGHKEARTWPNWYPGPFWREAVIMLIKAAQAGLGRQLIVPLGHQQEGLRFDARTTYEHLIYWYAKYKYRNVRWEIE